MEIILWGPGGTVAIWELTEQAYNYWQDKPRKMLLAKGTPNSSGL